MKSSVTSLNLTFCTLMVILLSSCAFPLTSPRSGEVRGRVLDASTHAPIVGAKVFLIEPPHHTTYTDKAGYFRLKAVRDFHLVNGPAGPSGKDCFAYVSHPKYKLYDFGALGGDLGDVLLQPQP
jgi:hypothetical protein